MYSVGKFVGFCSNGAKVFDRNDGHNNVHPVDESLLQEALLQVSPSENFVKKLVMFDRIIGQTTCVTVDETDTVVKAFRKGRKGPTPMVLNRTPMDCNSLVVILKKIGDDEYILITTFVGQMSEREPWDPAIVPGSLEQQKAEAFWSTHALIYDESIIVQIA